MSLIEISDVSLSRGNRQVLHNLDWVVPEGITALIGENGQGKTSLLRACLGLLPIDSGTITLLGTKLNGELTSAVSRKLGWVPQSPRLPSGATVESLVRHSAWLRGMPKEHRPEATEIALSRVNMNEMRHRKAKKLSGGEQRRVCLAMALVGNPDLLILDEPTVGLDPRQRKAFLQAIDAAVTSGDIRGAVFSTHILEDAAEVAHHCHMLKNGMIHYFSHMEGSENASATESMISKLREFLESTPILESEK